MRFLFFFGKYAFACFVCLIVNFVTQVSKNVREAAITALSRFLSYKLLVATPVVEGLLRTWGRVVFSTQVRGLVAPTNSFVPSDVDCARLVSIV